LIEQIGIEPRRTAFRSAWQKGIAERWVGSARRELLDHVIALNERHLQRLLHEYVEYYNADRVVCQKSAEQKPSRFRGLAIRCGCRFRPNFRNLCGLRWSL